jgi:hypothetical protein
MAAKIAKYKLPHSEEALDTLANSVFTYGSPHIEGASADWTDILLTSWTAFKEAVAAWTPAYAACKGAHLPHDTEVKNIAEGALRAALSDLLARGLLIAPRTTADAVAMGFHLVDDSRTTVTEVSDSVDIDDITNGIIPGSHTHVMHYRVAGKSNRAKAPYHLAVIQVFIRGKDDPEPVLNSEEGWGKDYISLSEPFEIRHDPGDVGKTAYYRAHWETDSGVKGPWSMASAEVP